MKTKVQQRFTRKSTAKTSGSSSVSQRNAKKETRYVKNERKTESTTQGADEVAATSELGANALAKYDVKFAASNLIRNGKIFVDDLKSMIPKNTPNTFRPSETIKEGYKYKFEVNGQKVEVKWHSPDLNAKHLYPNSNSGNMWTTQVKIGKKLLGADGNLYKKPNKLTHIPIQ